MTKQHFCSAIDNENSLLIFDEDDQQWQLTLMKIATDDDLENNHHLENVGDIIEQITIPVNFCPYCGKELLNNNSKIASYVCHDFSHW